MRSLSASIATCSHILLRMACYHAHALYCTVNDYSGHRRSALCHKNVMQEYRMCGTVPDLQLPGRGFNCARGCCAPTPTQRAIPPGSVNEYQRKLESKRAYHAMHWPRIRGLAASAGVRKTKGNGDQRRPMGPRDSGRTLLSFMLRCDRP